MMTFWLVLGAIGLAAVGAAVLAAQLDPPRKDLKMPDLPNDKKAHLHLDQLDAAGNPVLPFVGTTEWSADPPICDFVIDTRSDGMGQDHSGAYAMPNGPVGDTTVTARTTLPSGAVLTISTTVTITQPAPPPPPPPPPPPSEPTSMVLTVGPPEDR